MANAIKILDLDLDFFLDCNLTRPTRTKKRIENRFVPWSVEDVQTFLERNCGLTKQNKTKGKVFEHHDELYFFCQSLRKELPNITFHVDHVDAHADLGILDGPFNKIFTDGRIMIGKDSIGKEMEKEYNLNPGNFISFMLLQRWLASYTYINHSHLLNGDLNPIFTFKNELGNFFLKPQYFEGLTQMKELISGIDLQACYVPLSLIDYRQFNNCHKYDYVFLTKSPDYTPEASDLLIPVISEYINIIA